MVAFLDIVVAVALIIVIVYLGYCIKQYKVEKFFEQFPAPPTVPFFGNALDFGSSTTGFLKTLHRYRVNHGKIVNIRVGIFRRLLLVSDYRWLEFVMSTNHILAKSENYRFLYDWLGTGLLTNPGDSKWKKHRKIITPAFHYKILEQFLDIFESAGTVLINKLKQKSGTKSLDIYPYITLCTLDIICESAMGTPMNAQGDEGSPYVHSVKEMCRILVERSLSPIKGNMFLYPLTKDYRIEKQCLKILHDYTNQVIDRKRKELEGKGSAEDEDDGLGVKKKKAFLDLMLETTVAGQPLTNEEIREEVDTFMFAGHDTTASGTSFALFCIANHPDVQAKVLEEQRLIFGHAKNPTVTYSNLQDMKYLEQVVKETLRLYSPVPLYGRQSTQEVNFDGVVIPAGVSIGLFAHGIHKDPEYFPDPEKFDPDRFKNTEGRPPYAYVPFSAGPRNCIGQKYAMLESKSVISRVVRNFELSSAFPKHDLELSGETVLKSINGIKIGLRERI